MRFRLSLMLACTGFVAVPIAGEATPQFARKYRVDCSHCHASPPRLNARGLRFLEAGYRMDGARPTIPIAVWNTVDVEWRHSADLTKGFPSRVELISSGPIGRSRAAYFVEWRALSQGIGGDRRLLDRSGRFEDLFVTAPLPGAGRLSITAGQFRTLLQVDVSQRLSVSEPLAFSSSVPGERAATSRLTSLRAFSASGRQPGARVEYRSGPPSAGGWWTAAATLPLTGEFTVPFTDAASFEFEGRPKGVFLEAFHRRGLSSFGGHAFVGNAGRNTATAVVTHDIGGRLALLAAAGTFRSSAGRDVRLSAGGELTLSRVVVSGVRIDHQTRQNRDPAVLFYANGHLPFGPAEFRQALRVQVEQRVQRRNHTTTVALSHVF